MTPRPLVAALLLGLTIFLPATSPAETGATAVQAAGTPRADRFRQALGIDPGNLYLRYHLGVALLLEGEMAQAIPELRLAYPAFADSIEMNFNLSLALAQSGDPDSALLYLERAEELGALDTAGLYPLADNYNNLAIQYLDAGNDPEAERMFRKALQLAPDRLEIRRLLGDLLARSGNTEAALQEFAVYLEGRPEDAAARDYVFALHINQAIALLESDPQQARDAFSRAREIAPDHPLPLYYLGYLDYTRANMEGAAKQLTAAYPDADQEVRQSIRSLLHNCALNLLRQRKSRAALDALAPLIEGPAPAVKDLTLAGGIHLNLKQYSDAYRYFDQALALDPTNREATINRLAAEAGAVEELLTKGQVEISAGNFAAAQEYLARASAINPADPRPAEALEAAQAKRRHQAAELFSQARLELDQGHPRGALEKAREGLELDPASESGHELERQAVTLLHTELSQTLAKADTVLEQGNLAAAREAFTRILELAPDDPSALQGLSRVAGLSAAKAAELLTLANSATAEGEFAKAREAFEQALALQPDLTEARQGLNQLEALVDARAAEARLRGRKALEQGRLNQAREHFESALGLRDNAAAQAELAQVAQATRSRVKELLKQAGKAQTAHNYREARTLYAKALQASPEATEARRGLETLELEVAQQINQTLQAAEAELAAQNFAAALSHYRQILRWEATHAAALQGLETGRLKLADKLAGLVADATAAMEQGDFSTAESRIREALALDPYHAEAQAALGRVEQLRLSGVKPGDEERLYLQGIEFYTRGRYDEAIAAWKQVLALEPGHEKARMNIEKASRKLRQIREFGNG